MTYPFRDGLGNIKYAATQSGAGTEGDPFVLGGINLPTSYTHTIAIADDNGASLMVANPSRKYAIFINRDNVNDCDLFLGSLGNYGDGIPLFAGGGSFEIKRDNLFTGIVWGITAMGKTAKISMLEGI